MDELIFDEMAFDEMEVDDMAQGKMTYDDMAQGEMTLLFNFISSVGIYQND